MTQEKVMMTSYRNGNVATISVERVPDVTRKETVHYEGIGQHTGLVINRQGNITELENIPPPEMQLEFTCVMYNKEKGENHAERRCLKFWYKSDIEHQKRLDGAYEFFRELINPTTFPRDYVGFIKKMMKQIQSARFQHLRRIDVDLITLPPGDIDARVQELDSRPPEIKLKEDLHRSLDEAYPNVMTITDLKNIMQKTDENAIKIQLEELVNEKVIVVVPMEGKLKGQVGYRCNYPGDAHVNQGNIAQVARDEKPTIAIITNLLCEKLAVDAMMTDRTTFARFKTEGDSHVYTIGKIGEHKVISTKLPSIGRLLKEKISSGSTTTRLLGAFQEVKHVFIVGVGGSVPHVYEFDKHSRLGDIVVSTPLHSLASKDSQHVSEKDYMYLFCEKVIVPPEDAPQDAPLQFLLKYYKPEDLQLQNCVEKVLEDYESNPEQCPWSLNMESARERMQTEHNIDFRRPSPDTDRYTMKMSGGMAFGFSHPEPPPDLRHLYKEGVSAVRMGCIGSGRPVSDNDHLRDNFALEYNLLAWDAEYDQVLESIMGNRLGSYIFIRGISDYKDGATGTLWQPYASLAAAGFMKAVISKIRR
jgi:nucleoside phosphorylase